MSMIRGSGGSSSVNRPWRNLLQTRRGKKAISSLTDDAVPEVSPKLLHSHRDTDDLRQAAEQYRRRKRANVESAVEFSFDDASGQILVIINDELTGGLKLRLTPEEVERILKSLEETEDNDSTLTSFFIDLKV